MPVIASTGMPSPKRVTVSVKLTQETVVRLRTFVRDNAGKPLYLEMGTFVEQAIVAQLDAYEQHHETGPEPRRVALDNSKRINHHTICR